MLNRKFLATVSLVLAAAYVLLSGCGSKNEPETTTEAQTSEVNAEAVNNSSDATNVTAENSEEIISENTTYTEQTSLYEEESSLAVEETSVAVVPQTVEEIVALFNKSANRIKPEAKKLPKTGKSAR